MTSLSARVLLVGILAAIAGISRLPFSPQTVPASATHPRPVFLDNRVGRIKGVTVVAFRSGGMSRGNRIHRSALFGHVPHVVKLGAEEQVRGVHAPGIVAFVADVEPVGNRPVVNLPRNAVASQISLAVPNGAVPSRPTPRPLPTSGLVGLGDSRPKPFRKGFSHREKITRNRANLHPATAWDGQEDEQC